MKPEDKKDNIKNDNEGKQDKIVKKSSYLKKKKI